MHQHDGAEPIYLLKERLTVNVGGKEKALGEGDAMYFNPAVPHSYPKAYVQWQLR